MNRRFLSVSLPRFRTDRLQRPRPLRPSLMGPIALVTEFERQILIAATNAAAERLGIGVGMPLTDARALAPHVAVQGVNDAACEQDLERLALWCQRFTPWTAPSIEHLRDDGLWLDITGCAHLFGGEEKMRQEVLRRLRQAGFTADAAIADTPGAAWALVRFGKLRILPSGADPMVALGPLPLAALRLMPNQIDRLARLGLRSIAQLAAMPRQALARRFTADVLRRLDQAFGRAPEPILPSRDEAPPTYRQPFNEPISTAEDIAEIARHFLQDMQRDLKQRGEGARLVALQFFRVDGVLRSVEIATSQPTDDPKTLLRLFTEHIERIDPGFGIDLAQLIVLHKEKKRLVQNALGGAPVAAGEACAALVDRLRNRLGPNSVMQLRSRASHIPEFASRPTVRKLQAQAAFAPQARPLGLLPRPQPIEATETDGEMPRRFLWQGRAFEVRASEGPERISPEWWRSSAPPRDYYRVTDSEGRRFWLYRQASRQGAPRWFLHGFFA